MLASTILPWFTAGSADEGIPPISGNAFDGPSIAIFVVALATLALLTLPFAAGDRPVGLDRWWAFAALSVAGWAGLVLRAVDIGAQEGGLATLTPDRAPGLWLAFVGLAILSRAAFEISQERAYS